MIVIKIMMFVFGAFVCCQGIIRNQKGIEGLQDMELRIVGTIWIVGSILIQI